MITNGFIVRCAESSADSIHARTSNGRVELCATEAGNTATIYARPEDARKLGEALVTMADSLGARASVTVPKVKAGDRVRVMRNRLRSTSAVMGEVYRVENVRGREIVVQGPPGSRFWYFSTDDIDSGDLVLISAEATKDAPETDREALLRKAKTFLSPGVVHSAADLVMVANFLAGGESA